MQPSRKTGVKSRALCAVATLLLFVVQTVGSADVREAPEYTVKAAYLLLFTRYVEWPAAAFASPTAPIEILVLGNDPFGAALDSTVAGRSSGGRSIVIRRATAFAANQHAHLIFIGADIQQRDEWLTRMRDTPALTVVDGRDGPTDAVITFVTEAQRAGARVRFDVNLVSMRRANLRINSQMLAAARRIQREPIAQEADR